VFRVRGHARCHGGGGTSARQFPILSAPVRCSRLGPERSPELRGLLTLHVTTLARGYPIKGRSRRLRELVGGLLRFVGHATDGSRPVVCVPIVAFRASRSGLPLDQAVSGNRNGSRDCGFTAYWAAWFLACWSLAFRRCSRRPAASVPGFKRPSIFSILKTYLFKKDSKCCKAIESIFLS